MFAYGEEDGVELSEDQILACGVALVAIALVVFNWVLRLFAEKNRQLRDLRTKLSKAEAKLAGFTAFTVVLLMPTCRFVNFIVLFFFNVLRVCLPWSPCRLNSSWATVTRPTPVTVK
jgi:hypothetical protein